MSTHYFLVVAEYDGITPPTFEVDTYYNGEAMEILIFDDYDQPVRTPQHTAWIRDKYLSDVLEIVLSKSLAHPTQLYKISGALKVNGVESNEEKTQ